ncbi:MAG TPA: permease-like cell division protein FtsX [Candidatus Gemmiger faecigallinarum]|nr:permease-like cell division protein FtsX [Candidatus Gemmiger faecigallinarum]
MRFSSFTYLVRQGLHNMRANRLMTLASMGVLTVCMILIGVAYLLGANVDAIVEYIGEQNETIVYLQDGLSEEQIASADTAIRSTPGVVSVTYVSPEQVLESYSSVLEGYSDMYEAFANDNPFSANYRVVIEDITQLEQVSAQLEQIEGVERVRAPLELSDAFTSIQRVVTAVSYGLVIVLAIVSIVVVSNTIRITVFARRKEIAIMKLVGATNGFIRFPFFVEGTTSGLISAVVASGVVCGGYYALCDWYVANPSTFSQMFGGQLVPLGSVWYYIVIGFLLLGFILCGIGTAASIRKHLDV